jgi:hypothetical protein
MLADHGQMQAEMLEGLAQNFATNEYRLLIIDSVMALYRTDFVGRGELSERQQVLGAFLRRATQMAEEFNLCVLMVYDFASSCLHGLTLPRQTRSCPIRAPVLYSLGLMVVNRLEDTFSLMLLLPDFSSAKVVERSALQRLLILLVSNF